MKIMILGAAGFIGTNLAIKLAENENNQITLVDKSIKYFDHLKKFCYTNVSFIESTLDNNMDFNILDNQEVIYHLVSTNAPTTSNKHITNDIEMNVVFSAHLFEACIEHKVKKVIFISSGGTVYGKESICPITENSQTNPISSYGIQKITIEKLMYLYNYIYGLDYKIIRLANPYGPYQRPNGKLGAVTTFTYRALRGEEIQVYGNGSIVRDYIYIDDAIRAIINISFGDSNYHLFNLGSGVGTTINDVLKIIERTLNVKLKINYKKERVVDVPVNYLDISRYEKEFGKLNPISLEVGIKKTADFMLANGDV